MCERNIRIYFADDSLGHFFGSTLDLFFGSTLGLFSGSTSTASRATNISILHLLRPHVASLSSAIAPTSAIHSPFAHHHQPSAIHLLLLPPPTHSCRHRPLLLPLSTHSCRHRHRLQQERICPKMRSSVSFRPSTRSFSGLNALVDVHCRSSPCHFHPTLTIHIPASYSLLRLNALVDVHCRSSPCHFHPTLTIHIPASYSTYVYIQIKLE